MRELEDIKLESLAKSVDLDQDDITEIKSSRKRGFLSKINPIYWLGQFFIIVISLFYNVVIGIQKRNATYPFESWVIPAFLAPLPLSVHIINGIYSFTGYKRLGSSKRVRILVFFLNLSIFAFLFYIYYLSFPKVYQSGVKYGVFDAKNTRKTFVDFFKNQG